MRAAAAQERQAQVASFAQMAAQSQKPMAAQSQKPMAAQSQKPMAAQGGAATPAVAVAVAANAQYRADGNETCNDMACDCDACILQEPADGE
jgi:hypothetical protein